MGIISSIKKNIRGSVIVEATIVFPVMFLVIFLMLFAANGYLQKCRVEEVVQKEALDGAALCADPLLEHAQKGSLPSYKKLDAKPYRYLLGGMDGIENDIGKNIKDSIKKINTGFFSGMMPAASTPKAEFIPHFIYSTFKVDVNYKIKLPIRLFDQDFFYMKFSSHADVPVTDTPEFIRNVEMVDDYVERYANGFREKIVDMVHKAQEWLK